MKEIEENAFFSKQVVLFDQNVADRTAALKQIATALYQQQVVTADFQAAILTREADYPTGLLLSSGIGVAIPHTDADKVLVNQIGFISLAQPVEFRQMGSDTDTVQVSIIMPLALASAHMQLDMLQKLMQLFSDDQAMLTLQKITTVPALISFFTHAGIK